ncbi:AraC family transcriptional regulator [Vibrio tetraodonis]|uniref:AraC family transcriptional regulator n=1 Tax=Vibrio tetraodonis TaxID=2231647 RepID=UPI0013B40763|nr:helix-turn-helix transcriptional regulator [Vibrio tetraodonis]
MDKKVPSIGSIDCGVMLRSEDLLPRERFPEHSHAWYQFVYATKGDLIVTIDSSKYLITSSHGILIPPGMNHSTSTKYGATFRSLYVDEIESVQKSYIYKINDMMKSLICELDRAILDGEHTGYLSKIKSLISDQFERLYSETVYIPWPRDEKIQKICDYIYSNIGDNSCIDKLPEIFFLSKRTILRKFESELGMSIRDWRQKAKLFIALQLLNSDQSITSIALDLGYANVSAFTYMFTNEMGTTPSLWRKTHKH